MSYRLNEPMSWQEFKSMPLDIQKIYIKKLMETYNANMMMLARMFGKDNSLISRYVKNRLDIVLPRGGSNRMSDEEKVVFERFCNGSYEPESISDEIVNEEQREVPIAKDGLTDGVFDENIENDEENETEDCKCDVVCSSDDYLERKKKVNDFIYEMSGDLDWNVIYTILASVSSSTTKGRFSMSYESE